MKPLYTTIEVTEKTQTQKLPVSAQLRLLLGKVNNNENVKLEASEKVSKAHLEITSALSNLIDVTTAKMRELGERSVTLSVSSRFKPYFKEILSEQTGKGRFYDFVICDKEMPVIGMDYFLIMTIKEKED